MEDVITQRGGPIASCFQSFKKLRLHFPIHLLWKSETSARFLGCSTRWLPVVNLLQRFSQESSTSAMGNHDNATRSFERARHPL